MQPTVTTESGQVDGVAGSQDSDVLSDVVRPVGESRPRAHLAIEPVIGGAQLSLRPVIVVESLARVYKLEFIYETLERCGIPCNEVIVVAAVPLDTRDVKRRHIKDGLPQLMQAIGRSSGVLLVGNVPLEAITDKKGIKQKRGRPFEKGGSVYVPTMPPGTLIYDEGVKPMLEADIRLFADVCKRGGIPREEALDWTIVDTARKFEAMLENLKGTVSFDIETNGLYPWSVTVGGIKTDPKVQSIGFGTRTKQWCLPLSHAESTWRTDEHAGMMRRIDERLRDCYLVAQNGKFDSLWLRVHYGVDWRPDFDTMLAHYMLDENSRHGLKILAQVYFGAPNYDADMDTKTGGGPIHDHCMYLAHDVYYTRRLRFAFGKLLAKDPKVERVFERLMMPIANLFIDIEFQGVCVDYERYEEAEVHLRDELKLAEKELRKHGNINWRSPQQLAKLFFEDLGLAVIDRTEGGAPSTNESVLLRIDHPAARALLKYRSADQMLKMFIDGWKPFLVQDEHGQWRLHPSFKLHGTVTGRASCEHPNLQQVPRESLIRSLIGASIGATLLEIDLSQIEMRIAAELSGDQTLLGLFDRDEDVHWLTATREIGRAGAMAKEVLATAEKHLGKKVSYADAIKALWEMGPDRAIELESAWKELRKKAKAINFGFLFGMWWKKFRQYARDNYGVEVSDKQAQDARKNFFSLYRSLAPWHDRQRRYAMRHGQVRSLTGALRRLPDAMSQDDSPKRGEALRQAINSPVQRFACELNFMVLLQLKKEFGDHVRPVGTVHDACLIEVDDDWVERVYKRAHQIMEKPEMLEDFQVKLRVPIKGDGKLGNWSKGVSLEAWKKARKK